MAKSTIRRMKTRHRPFARMVRDADRLCRKLREFGWSDDPEQILIDLLGPPPKDATGADVLARQAVAADALDAVMSTAFALQQFRAALSQDYGGRKWFAATEDRADV